MRIIKRTFTPRLTITIIHLNVIKNVTVSMDKSVFAYMQVHIRPARHGKTNEKDLWTKYAKSGLIVHNHMLV